MIFSRIQSIQRKYHMLTINDILTIVTMIVSIVTIAFGIIVLPVISSLVERTFLPELYYSKINLRNSRTKFFLARTISTEYQQSCAPTSDSIENLASDVEDALANLEQTMSRSTSAKKHLY